MGVGALVSVSGSDESGILGTARLSYAMSIDGLFPKLFSRIHPRYQTPYMALIVQGITAFVLSIFSGITQLISFSVLNLAFAFMLTCFALLVLERGGTKKLRGQRLLPIIGIIICVYLLYATSLFNKVVGLTVIALGIPLYVFFSPKADIHHLKEFFLSEEAIFVRRLERKKRFLANFLSLLHRGYRKVKTNERS